MQTVADRISQQSPRSKALTQEPTRARREKTPATDVPKSDRELRSHSRQAQDVEMGEIPPTPEAKATGSAPQAESSKPEQSSIEMIDLTEEVSSSKPEHDL